MFHTLKAQYVKMHDNNDRAYKHGRTMGEYLKVKRYIQRLERELDNMMKKT